MTDIKIYNATNELLYTFSRVLSASLADKLSGECTLSFSVLAQEIELGYKAELLGQIYNIVKIKKQISSGLHTITAECEHISYMLNDEQYNLKSFYFSGTAIDGLKKLLDGTPLQAGVCEIEDEIIVSLPSGNYSRRKVLMHYIGTIGGEIEYDGYKINIRKHRGRTERKQLMDGENVTNVAMTIDSRSDTATYDIQLFKIADLKAGDEVHIKYKPMGIAVDTRIIAIIYNPFYSLEVRVEVGDYMPNLIQATARQINSIQDQFEAVETEIKKDRGLPLTAKKESNSVIMTFDGDVTVTITAEFDADGNITSMSEKVEEPEEEETS